ncbi:MAG: MFS transporter [Acholeplasma sp.]|jgi:MFS family permease|nr:MAG: MFS transporter [Acholeplasma sp.]
MQNNDKKKAYLFLLLIGIIALLSDFTHEGARSIYGPYLGLIGVSAFLISLTAGLGEFIGQALRIVTGFIADKTKKYWFMMILGYSINLLVIPLLMFVDATIWQVAIILILLERVGKGIRAPAKSALVSFTTSHIGTGKAFALQEFMDQIGAFLGPLFVFVVLNLNQGSELNGYHLAFGLLGIFAIMTLVIIVYAKSKYPHPDHMEIQTKSRGFKGNKTLIFYLIAVSFIAIGFIDYPILAFHLSNTNAINVIYVPLLYSMAMGVDALSALFFGYTYDKKGVKILHLSILSSILFVPIFFLLDGTLGIIIGMIFWGISMGAMESILKAVIASLVSKDKRATAYGIFYTVFGGAWFLGSTMIGLLYDLNILYVIIFSTAMEVLAMIALAFYIYQFKKETLNARTS